MSQQNASAGASTQRPECRLALVIVSDSSGSVTSEWDRIMRGTAEAINSDVVRTRNASQPVGFGPIAVRAIDFSTGSIERAPWQMLETPADHTAFAARFLSPRLLYGGTHIAAAMDNATQSFAQAPCQPRRWVMDVASDADDTNIEGIQAARDRFIAAAEAAGATAVINAIPTGATGQCHSTVTGVGRCSAEQALRENVITPNGQVFPVADMEDFERMMARKVAEETAELLTPDTPGTTPQVPRTQLAQR